MNYELAKQLNDAGFQQRWDSNHFYYLADGSRIKFPVIKDAVDEMGMQINYASRLIMIPTLEELIEAVASNGGTFSALQCSDGMWRATGFNNELDLWESLTCSSPVEAAARLWLALQKWG